MSNPEQAAAEEQGDNNSSFNEHLKENKAAAGERFKTPLSFAVFKVGAE